MSVGELIRDRRLALGLTQVDLFKRTGIEQYYISQIERGKIARPGRTFLIQIAEALAMPADTLLLAADYAVGASGSLLSDADVERVATAVACKVREMLPVPA